MQESQYRRPLYNVLTWIIGDHLGSTTALANEDGSLKTLMRYTAYGEIRTAYGSDQATDYRYTGQRSEGEIGLYYYVARMYDPALGRFIQPDSIIPDPGSSKGYDRYAYVNNNPVNFNDPSGHGPSWLDFLSGATIQFLDDMSSGGLSYILGDVDCLNTDNASFQEGREWGRGTAATVAMAETTIGTVAAIGALASIGPTTGIGMVAALPSGGASVIVLGVAIPVEVAIAGAGTLVAAHGFDVMTYMKGNTDPADIVLQRGGNTLSKRVSEGLGLSKEDAKAAIEALKDELKLSHDSHFTIMGNGDYIGPDGKVLGNLYDYVP